MVDDQDGCEWVHVFSGTGSPGSPGQRAVKRLLLLLLLEEQSIEMTQKRHVQTSPNVACEAVTVAPSSSSSAEIGYVLPVPRMT